MQAARSSSAQQQRAAAARSGSANPSKIATVRKPEHNSDHLERVKRGTMALVPACHYAIVCKPEPFAPDAMSVSLSYRFDDLQ